MRKVLRLTLLSLILIISLTTICLAEEKINLDIFDLIKHAPFFGHAFNTEKFTYIGIYYPSFIYEEEKNELTLEFEKIDERTVRYEFEPDCPPFLPLKNKIKVKETVSDLIQPENYSSVVLETICTFIRMPDKEPLFNEIGGNFKKWIYLEPDWSLQIYKNGPLGPVEREYLMKRTLESYLAQVKAKDLREELMREVYEKGKWAQRTVKDSVSIEIPTIKEWPHPVVLPDQPFVTIDETFIQFLKSDIINLIPKLRFDPLGKVCCYVYFPTRDHSGFLGNRVLLRYELGLNEIKLPPGVPQLNLR